VPDALSKLTSEYGEERLKVITGVDLEDPKSIEHGCQVIAEQCSEGVDLLINCAGILGDHSVEMPGPERSVLKVDPTWIRKTMDVNFISHVLLTQGIAPLMKRKVIKGEPAPAATKIVNISARVGSINDNHLGGWLSYRCSKSALNQFTKTASIELKRHHCAVLSLHPGTTDTGLSKPFQKNLPAGQLMSPAVAVTSMLRVIEGATLESSGSFLSYDGVPIEW
jgi:NAD(P)-dependent dehydrogenase (short-subunit alcohol dehydrogenase family)